MRGDIGPCVGWAECMDVVGFGFDVNGNILVESRSYYGVVVSDLAEQ